MQRRKTIKWLDPLAVARSIPDNEECWVLLYSGMDQGFSGNRSILALRAGQQIKASDFDALDKMLTSDRDAFANAWFGYLGYGLKNVLEILPEDVPGIISLPDMWMVQYGLVLVFDHVRKKIDVWAADDNVLQYIPQAEEADTLPEVQVEQLQSNMTKGHYLQKVASVKDAIFRGDVYQANLTRKFYGTLKKTPRPVDVFCQLCQVSPAPYSAFIKLQDSAIISSSPERFLHVGAQGEVNTMPIKGSIGRHDDAQLDAKARQELAQSEKDQAENLMIVDLSRNDLSRGCVPGSVKVENLFEVVSYATVHHMVSGVYGQKKEDVSTLELVKGCFPPGSMTGTPKIKAMQMCSALEELKRGVYSGAIGWFGGDGSADLSVVIRTLIMQGNRFEFQVGGAIVADSVPEKEWEETLVKARAVAKVMGIEQQQLEGL